MHHWGFFFPQKINELKFLKWNEVIEDKHGSSCCHCCPACPARPAPFGVAGVSLHFLSVSPSCFSLNNLIKRRGSQSDHLLIDSELRPEFQCCKESWSMADIVIRLDAEPMAIKRNSLIQWTQYADFDRLPLKLHGNHGLKSLKTNDNW